MKVPVRSFALYDRDMNLVVEPGEFELQIGASSLDIRGRQIISVGEKACADVLQEETLDISSGKTIVLSGVIRDIQATPVGGVTVKSLGTGASVKSSADGTYRIRTKVGDVLELSGDGLKTRKYKVKYDQKEVDIIMNYSNEI